MAVRLCDCVCVYVCVVCLSVRRTGAHSVMLWLPGIDPVAHDATLRRIQVPQQWKIQEEWPYREMSPPEGREGQYMFGIRSVRRCLSLRKEHHLFQTQRAIRNVMMYGNGLLELILARLVLG